MNFMIESTSRFRIKHALSKALIKACKSLNWSLDRNEHLCILSPHRPFDGRADRFIPVGSVKFVHDYISIYYHYKSPLPINIPKQLMQECFTGREVYNGKKIKYKHGFSANRTDHVVCDIKGIKWRDFDNESPCCLSSEDAEWQFSAPIKLDSIWRAFVFEGDLVGLQRCSGDITVFPCTVAIQDMMDAWDDSPIAYTLDVGVIEKKNSTVVLGADHFYSIDLFGFSCEKLPYMLAAWFYEYIGFDDWRSLMPEAKT